MSIRKNRQRSWLALLFSILFVVLILSSCTREKLALISSAELPTPALNPDNEVVATYKDGKVNKGELEKFIQTLIFMNTSQAPNKDVPAFREFILKQLVMTKILNERASEQSKSAAEVKVKQQMYPIMQLDLQKKAGDEQ